MSPSSLQGRLSGAISLLVLGGGLVSASVGYFKVYEDAHEMQDAQLQQLAVLVAGSKPDLGRIKGVGLLTIDPEDQVVVEVFASRAAGLPLTQALPDGASSSLSTIDVGGLPWRLVTQAKADGQVVVVRQQTEVRDEIARHSAWQVLLPLLFLMPGVIALLHVIIRRSFDPVRALQAQLDQAASDAPTALPDNKVPSELLPFVRSINAMMNRVCEAQARQRRFVADAAHELRTPIAALSLQADNLAATLTDPAQTGERVQVLQEGLVRTKALLEQLLSLSRLQGHSPDVPYGGCDVLEVLREVVADLMPLASDRQVDLGVIEAQPCSLACHPFELKALLGNVLGNAIQHGRPSGQVDVTLRCDGLRVHLLVDDDGPGLAPEHTVRVFSPFYKAGDSTGTGLGLAIVKAMADKLQAHVSLGTRPDGHAGCRFSLNAPQHLPD